MLHLAFNLQFDGLLLEREELLEQEPSYEKKQDGKWEHIHHPLTETDAHIKAGRSVEILEGDGVRRRTDRRSHTADVGSYWDGQRERHATLAFRRKRLEDGSKEGEHHGCRGGVADEHREDTSDEDKSEQYVLTLVAEGLEEGTRQKHVQS